jgi:ubiquinone/menaquinone biosynthesis C-methylase UbiE
LNGENKPETKALKEARITSGKRLVSDFLSNFSYHAPLGGDSPAVLWEELMADPEHPDLYAAAATWNIDDEDIEETNKRIHGRVSLEELHTRADAFISTIFNTFPYVQIPANATIMDIGSGTGYLMEAMNRLATRLAGKSPPKKIIGLDIAENMLAKAKERLGEGGAYGYLHYDGLHIPMDNNSVDLIYSAAALQHVPKVYVYNLFFEIHRILKPTGFAVIHLASFKQLIRRRKKGGKPWRTEIANQIERKTAHWLHFYTKEELEIVLSVGNDFEHVDVREEKALWFCARKTQFSPKDAPKTEGEVNPFSGLSQNA